MVTAEGISTPSDRAIVPESKLNDGSEKWLGVGWDQLTSNGKRQMYQLGVALREDYPELLGGGLSGSQIFVHCDGNSKSTSSATSLLSAIVSNSKTDIIDLPIDKRLYPFLQNQSIINQLSREASFPKALPFTRDLAFITAPDKTDPKFRLNPNEVCPKFFHGAALTKRFLQDIYRRIGHLSDESDTMYEKLMIKKKYSKETSQNDTSPLALNIIFLGEYLLARVYADNEIDPSVVSDDFLEKLKFAMNYYSLHSTGNDHEDRFRLASTPLLQSIQSVLHDVGQTKRIIGLQGRRLHLYSGNIATLVGLQDTLIGINNTCVDLEASTGVKEPGCANLPGYSSSMIFEVVDINDQTFVRTRLDGEYVKTCARDTTEPRFSCPIDDWQGYVSNKILKDWQKQCMETPTTVEPHKALFTAVILMCLGFILVIILVIFSVIGFFKSDMEGTDSQPIGANISSHLMNFKPVGTHEKEDFALDQDEYTANVKRF